MLPESHPWGRAGGERLRTRRALGFTGRVASGETHLLSGCPRRFLKIDPICLAALGSQQNPAEGTDCAHGPPVPTEAGPPPPPTPPPQRPSCHPRKPALPHRHPKPESGRVAPGGASEVWTNANDVRPPLCCGAQRGGPPALWALPVHILFPHPRRPPSICGSITWLFPERPGVGIMWFAAFAEQPLPLPHIH